MKLDIMNSFYFATISLMVQRQLIPVIYLVARYNLKNLIGFVICVAFNNIILLSFAK